MTEFNSRAYYFISTVTLLLSIAFWIVHILYPKPDFHCESDVNCLNDGTCDTLTKRCRCSHFAEFPFCDPVIQYGIEYHGFGIAAFTLLVFNIVLFFKYFFP